MTRSARGPALVLAGSVALLVGILAIAAAGALSSAGPGGEAARIVPAGALAFVRLSTDPDDPAARRLQRLAPRIPGFLSLRDSALGAVSLAPGAFDPQRDVRPWLGDEAAVALVDIGGGRFGSLVLAQVRSRPRAEALLQRVAGRGRGVRYRETVLRRFGPNAAAFAGGFLLAGPEAAVRRAVDVARGDAPALADAPGFEAALEGSRQPAEAYVSPRGLRSFVREQGGVARVVAGLLDGPKLRGVGVSARADARGLRLHAAAPGSGRGGGGAAARRRRPGRRRGAARRAEPDRRRRGGAARGRRRGARHGARDAARGRLARPRARPARAAGRRVRRLGRARRRGARGHARGAHDRPGRHARGARAAAGPAGARAGRRPGRAAALRGPLDRRRRRLHARHRRRLRAHVRRHGRTPWWRRRAPPGSRRSGAGRRGCAMREAFAPR